MRLPSCVWWPQAPCAWAAHILRPHLLLCKPPCPILAPYSPLAPLATGGHLLSLEILEFCSTFHRTLHKEWSLGAGTKGRDSQSTLQLQERTETVGSSHPVASTNPEGAKGSLLSPPELLASGLSQGSQWTTPPGVHCSEASTTSIPADSQRTGSELLPGLGCSVLCPTCHALQPGG
jgi:hypothetical protein